MYLIFSNSVVLGGGRHAAAGDVVQFANAAEARPWILGGHARAAEPKEIKAFEKSRDQEAKRTEKEAARGGTETGSGSELTETGDPNAESRDPRPQGR